MEVFLILQFLLMLFWMMVAWRAMAALERMATSLGRIQRTVEHPPHAGSAATDA